MRLKAVFSSPIYRLELKLHVVPSNTFAALDQNATAMLFKTVPVTTRTTRVSFKGCATGMMICRHKTMSKVLRIFPRKVLLSGSDLSLPPQNALSQVPPVENRLPQTR
jgi:hypothetical protein